MWYYILAATLAMDCQRLSYHVRLSKWVRIPFVPLVRCDHICLWACVLYLGSFLFVNFVMCVAAAKCYILDIVKRVLELRKKHESTQLSAQSNGSEVNPLECFSGSDDSVTSSPLCLILYSCTLVEGSGTSICRFYMRCSHSCRVGYFVL